MPIRPLVITSLFAASAVLASMSTSVAAPRASHQTATQIDQALEVSAAKKKARRSSAGNAAYGRGSQIACNPAGCFPVPGYCTITAAKTFGGTPTGYDAVICPRR